eukprot:TRINITY_DN3400_c0_g1_i1.p1 TRINITY_DN3400_c0_g1~~TRINITY_DN3400_c0_g1_i1.p1  ORF type:complete len:355 (+),score=82.72 TRINITY_DN3400_c0_g1_i1:28-1092(+)
MSNNNELQLRFERVRRETDDMLSQIRGMKENGAIDRAWEVLLEFQRKIESMSENRFGNIANEMLLKIFGHCDVEDVSSLSLVCKRFRTLIYGNSVLWKILSNRLWDEARLHYPFSHLEFIIEHLNELSWLWVARCLSNRAKNGLGFIEDEDKEILMGKLTDRKLNDERGLVIFKEGADFGKFCSDKDFSGPGRRIIMSGDEYIGDFKQHDFDGLGVWTFKGGTNYYGFFKKGQFKGNGIMCWPDGFTYQGAWKNNKPLDQEKSIHPIVQHYKRQEMCTKEAGDLPQQLMQCSNCQISKIWYCAVCFKTCHPCKEGEEKIQWVIGDACRCLNEHCKVLKEPSECFVPPLKRRKIE